MAAVELYKQDGTGTGIFYCSECRIVHENKDRAEWCHGERICACGKKIPQHDYGRKCGDCQGKEWKEKERLREVARFDAATKITEAEYKGEHVYNADQYFDSVDDAIDGYLEGQEPEYVWACKDRILPPIDLEDVTCNLLDNMWEDADIDDLHGIDELEAALNAFNKANESIVMWEPDYSTAILVGKTALQPPDAPRPDSRPAP